MKYWKGKTGSPKDGQFGTMEDTGFVPDSIICPKAEYDAWMNTRPAPSTLLERAQASDRDAIKQLIQEKGGWSTLTAAQKDAVLQLILGIPANL